MIIPGIMASVPLGWKSDGGANFPTPPGIPPDAIPLNNSGLWTISSAQPNFVVSFDEPAFDGVYSGGFVADKVSTTGSASITITSIGSWYQSLPAGTFYCFVQRIQDGTGIINSDVVFSCSKGPTVFASENWRLTSPQCNSGSYTQLRSGAYSTNNSVFNIVALIDAVKVTRLNIYLYYKI